MKKIINYFSKVTLCLLVSCCFVACGDKEYISDIEKPDSQSLSAMFNKSSLTFGSQYSSDQLVVTIKGGDNIEWYFETDAYWCYVEKSYGYESGTFNIAVLCEANEYDEDRSATITLTVSDERGNKKTACCTVTQKGKETLSLTNNEISVGKFGGEFEIEILSNIQYSYFIEEDAKGWINEPTSVDTRATQISTLKFTVQENNTSARVGHITIKGADKSEIFTITQSAGESEISIHVDSPGSLKNLISESRAKSVESITISGTINISDLELIQKMEKLKYLDLENAEIENGELSEYCYGMYINQNAVMKHHGWHLPYGFSTLVLPKTLKKWTFVFDSNGFDIAENLKIPAGIETVTISPVYVNQKGGKISNIYIDNISSFVTKDFEGLFCDETRLYCDKRFVTSVSVPAGTKKIGNAFRGYKYLEAITIPSSVQDISARAFDGCSISEMKINSFEHWAKVFNSYNTPFSSSNPGRLIYNGKWVESVEIPESITELHGAYAFVEGIKEVHCKSKTPAEIYVYDDFNLIDKNSAILYVPIGTKQSYNLSDWGTIFKNIVEE